MKNVIISIKSLQDYNVSESDEIELMTDGEYQHENGVSILTYRESELTGLEGTRTTIKVERDRVTMTRDGAVTTQMVFVEGEKHYFAYETPYGAITMGLDTFSIMSSLGKHGGDIKLRYVLNVDSAPLSRNEFKINVREVRSNV